MESVPVARELIRHTPELEADLRRPARLSTVYYATAPYTGPDGVCFVGTATIAAQARIAQRHVRDAFRQLEAKRRAIPLGEHRRGSRPYRYLPDQHRPGVPDHPLVAQWRNAGSPVRPYQRPSAPLRGAHSEQDEVRPFRTESAPLSDTKCAPTGGAEVREVSRTGTDFCSLFERPACRSCRDDRFQWDRPCPACGSCHHCHGRTLRWSDPPCSVCGRVGGNPPAKASRLVQLDHAWGWGSAATSSERSTPATP